jgi:hypothetical protein
MYLVPSKGFKNENGTSQNFQNGTAAVVCPYWLYIAPIIPHLTRTELKSKYLRLDTPLTGLLQARVNGIHTALYTALHSVRSKATRSRNHYHRSFSRLTLHPGLTLRPNQKSRVSKTPCNASAKRRTCCERTLPRCSRVKR